MSSPSIGRLHRVALLTASLVICALLLAVSLFPRDRRCQRCGGGLRMCGPVVVGICGHYFSGIRGDRGLFCQKHGHVPVSMDVAFEPLEDWEFHRDSYPS